MHDDSHTHMQIMEIQANISSPYERPQGDDEAASSSSSRSVCPAGVKLRRVSETQAVGEEASQTRNIWTTRHVCVLKTHEAVSIDYLISPCVALFTLTVIKKETIDRVDTASENWRTEQELIIKAPPAANSDANNRSGAVLV